MLAYALIGVFSFKGDIENRCRITPTPIDNRWLINETVVTLCNEETGGGCPIK